MKYLEARKKAAEFKDGYEMKFVLGMSGTSDHLELYLRAHASNYGISAQVGLIPFGTLVKYLFEPKIDAASELFLLFPWDFAPECDWRSGVGPVLVDVELILDRSRLIAELLSKRTLANIAYVPAPIPPICVCQADNDRISAELTLMSLKLGARLLNPAHFSISSYLLSGCPIAGNSMSDIAEELITLIMPRSSAHYKVIATDADNTLWAGLVGEDGVDKVAAEPNGIAFRYFIYQTVLQRLKSSGVLLAVISRNDEDMVIAPLNSGRMPLLQKDFVKISAGYGDKSSHLRTLAEYLNLGLDSIVFVDDNPVELAEVSSALPAITCLPFPTKDDDLPVFLDKLAKLFDRRELTSEDVGRTELYQRRLPASDSFDGVGFEGFLKSLNMQLIIRDRSDGDWTRAYQLINKTNQFNLNGVCREKEDISRVLTKNGRLITATLEDRSGSHGEILACLIDDAGLIISFVMSCRVFQRRVEFAFFSWLLSNLSHTIINLDFCPTERNEPFRLFLSDDAFLSNGKLMTVDVDKFLSNHSNDMSLIDVREDIE